MTKQFRKQHLFFEQNGQLLAALRSAFIDVNLEQSEVLLEKLYW